MYCSKECGIAARSVKASAKYQGERIKIVERSALCAYCGKRAARMYGSGRKMSKYCSAECGAAAKRDKSLELARLDGWGTENHGRQIPQMQKPLAMIGTTGGGEFPWNDLRYNPMG